MKILSSLICISLFALTHISTKAATFTVTNLNNSGAGSLRQAIADANSSPGQDDIVFSVSGTIYPSSVLPSITDTVNLDGSTAPGYVTCGPPVIRLDGSLAGAASGLLLLPGANGSTIHALNIGGFFVSRNTIHSSHALPSYGVLHRNQYIRGRRILEWTKWNPT